VLARALLVGLLLLVCGGAAQAQTTCSAGNYKTLTQVLTEFQSCVTQGLSAGCITAGTMQDLICSARKLTSGDFVTVTPSGATYTPDFNTGVNFSLTLTSSCPCTLANPTNQTNQSGILEIIQDGTGSRLVSTYGANYLASSTPTLSTAANAKDYVSYAVNPAGKIVFGTPVLNPH
jgi:hypothetical protein